MLEFFQSLADTKPAPHYLVIEPQTEEDQILLDKAKSLKNK